MAVSYLKKSKMYAVAKSLGFSDMSKMKDCTYKFYRGAEWLTFDCLEGYGKLSSQCGGNWFHFVIKSYDDDRVVREKVFVKEDLEKGFYDDLSFLAL